MHACASVLMHAFDGGRLRAESNLRQVGIKTKPAPAGQVFSEQLRRPIRDDRRWRASSCGPQPLSLGAQRLSGSPSVDGVRNPLPSGRNSKNIAFMRAPLATPATSRSLAGEGVSRDIERADLRGAVIAHTYACVCR